MKPVRWLTSAAVKTIQRELIDMYGGSHGIRDEGLIESALARGPNLYTYGHTESIPDLGATVAWGLLKNHAFVDGNKRIALAALFTFLDLNGWRLVCSEAEETVMTLRAAAGEVDDKGWTEWVRSATQPHPKKPKRQQR